MVPIRSGLSSATDTISGLMSVGQRRDGTLIRSTLARSPWVVNSLRSASSSVQEPSLENRPRGACVTDTRKPRASASKIRTPRMSPSGDNALTFTLKVWNACFSLSQAPVWPRLIRPS